MEDDSSAIYSEPLYSYPAPGGAAPTLRMDSDLTLICDSNNKPNLQLYGTLPRGYARNVPPRPTLADAKGLSKSSLYLFEGTPTTNAATFFSKENDDVFESSHYKQVLDPRALDRRNQDLRALDPRAFGYATLSRQAPYKPTTNLLCGPMVPAAHRPRVPVPVVLSPPQPNSTSSGNHKQPLTKKKSISLENLVEVPELESDGESPQATLPAPVSRSALKGSDESSRRSLTVTFVDPAGEKGVEEMESTPRRFFQALVSPVMGVVRRQNSLGMECEPSPPQQPSAERRPWTALMSHRRA